MTREAQNRKLAEWLFGKSLDGFCICSKSGYRLRERDFDSIGEAQRYIDAEDERLPESQKAAAKGVKILPCVKGHPNFFTSEEASALLLEKMPAAELYCHPPDHSGPEKGWRCRPDWGLDFCVYHPDRKTAVCLAALALITDGV